MRLSGAACHKGEGAQENCTRGGGCCTQRVECPRCWCCGQADEACCYHTWQGWGC
jgi:hypothetical protein